MSNSTLSPKLLLLQSIYTASIVTMNLMGGKIITILHTDVFGFDLNIQQSIAIFIVAIPFLISEIVQEVYTRKVAYQFMINGLIALFLVMIFNYISISINPAPRYLDNTAYTTIFDTSLRFILASLCAFGISLSGDIQVFTRLKATIGVDKWLWLRSDLASIVGIFLDTVVFMFLAFYLAYPGYDFLFVWNMTWPYFIYKYILTAFDTPLVYLGKNWLKKV
jgi:uncharacterized integral membrane protein (TIGR00697 family)